MPTMNMGDTFNLSNGVYHKLEFKRMHMVPHVGY